MNAVEDPIHAVIREFGRLLDMLGRELSRATREAGQQCAPLGGMFGRVAVANREIEHCVRDTPAEGPVLAHCAQVAEAISAAVVTLQYEDRLAQRIGHVRAGLDHLHSLLQDHPGRSHDDWMAVLQDVDLIQELNQQRMMPPDPAEHGSSELF